MSVWICSMCSFSRVGHYHSKTTVREVDGMNVPHMDICCGSCWDKWLEIDPMWDWDAEGWEAYR